MQGLQGEIVAVTAALGCVEIEIPDVADFIGFTGLVVTRFNVHFTRRVQIGWRLAFEHWGRGNATEAARLALGGFDALALSEIVSFTSATNLRSQAVTERLGIIVMPLRTSTIRRCRIANRSVRMCSTVSGRGLSRRPMIDCGRDAHYWAPPAQNRTCSIPASGSHLGCLTARCPYTVQSRGHACPVRSPARAGLSRVLLGPLPLLRQLRLRSPDAVRRLRSYFVEV
jgi:hypothetical protein